MSWRAILAVSLLAGAAEPAAPRQDWPQWGGPGRDFQAEGRGVEAWGPDGPRRLWQRELSEGFSGEAVVEGRLFTLLRQGENEVVVALDAQTGETLWQQAPAGGLSFRRGGGLDPRNGDLLWSHPYPTDYGLNVSTPVWGNDGLLFLSSAYGGGSRALVGTVLYLRDRKVLMAVELGVPRHQP